MALNYVQPDTTNLTPIKAGAPEYTQAAVNAYGQSIKPVYQQQLKDLRQNFSSRGLMDSGLGANAEMGLSQDYMRNMNTFGNQAALQGADVGEQRQRAQTQQDYALQSQANAFNFYNQQQERAHEYAQQMQREKMIGDMGGAAGSLIGSYGGLGLSNYLFPSDSGAAAGSSVAGGGGLMV